MPYAGPSCARAGVSSGRWYFTKEEAVKDADKLSDVNPVGMS